MTWPVESLVYGSYQYLMREVGGALEYGHDLAAWTHEQTGIVDSIVQRGVKAFYTPAVLPGDKYAHEWSFLRPVSSVVTVAGQYSYNLPADFAMLDGPMVFAPGDSALCQPIEYVAAYQVRVRLGDGLLTGRPEVVAIEPKLLDGLAGTRYIMLLFPVPDGAYPINYRCRLHPRPLSDANPMPFGGDAHYETILLSCLALAKPDKANEFLVRLKASVSHDRRFASPPQMGYNADPSNDLAFPDLHDWDRNLVTYKGRVW